MGAFSVNSALFPHPPEPQDYVSQYARLAQLRNALAMAPLQRQEAQQQIQAGQLDIQQKQQDIADQNTIREEMRNNPSGTFGGWATNLRGKILPKNLLQLQQADIQMQQAHAQLTDTQLKERQAQNDAYQGIYNSAQKMTDDQFQQNWPSIAESVNAVPGATFKVDPRQPMSKAEFSNHGPMIALQDAYLKAETARRESEAKTAEAAGKGAEAQAIAGEKEQQGQFFNKMGLPAGITPDMAGYAAYIQKGGKPEGFAAFKAQQEAAATQPYKIQTAMAEAKAKQAMEGLTVPGYAFDPATGTTGLTDQTAYLQSGGKLQGFRKVSEKDIRDDTMLTNRLGDVHQKLAEYEGALQKPISDKDKGNLASLLGTEGFKLGAFHTEIPLDRLNAALQAENLKGLSANARDQLVAYRNMREALLGYKTVLSGSARGSDKQMELLDQAIPIPSITDNDYSKRSIDSFRGNLRVVGQGLPTLPGIKNPKEIEQEVWGNKKTAVPGPGNAQYHYQGKKGEIFSNDGQTWFDASGQPVK